MSYAEATAPRRRAVAIACKPATPAPMMSTRPGVIVPAAVVSIGKMRGNVSAAMITALYPQIVPIEESASMLCARVVRGINSTAKEVTPVFASCCNSSSFPIGRRNPTIVCPLRINGKSALPVRSFEPKHRTWTTMSAVRKISARSTASFAPLAV